MMDPWKPASYAAMYTFLFSTFLMLAVPANKYTFAERSEQMLKDERPKSAKNNYFLDAIQKYAVQQLELSTVYLAYSSYFDRADVALPGFRDYFLKQSIEEVKQAQKLISYVSKRGGHVVVPNLKVPGWCGHIRKGSPENIHLPVSNRGCICSFVLRNPNIKHCTGHRHWQNGLYGMSDVYYIENYMLSQLMALHKAATHDPVGRHLLETDFLTPKVGSIYAVNSTLTELMRFLKMNEYFVGEYIIDTHFAE